MIDRSVGQVSTAPYPLGHPVAAGWLLSFFLLPLVYHRWRCDETVVSVPCFYFGGLCLYLRPASPYMTGLSDYLLSLSLYQSIMIEFDGEETFNESPLTYAKLDDVIQRNDDLRDSTV